MEGEKAHTNSSTTTKQKCQLDEKEECNSDSNLEKNQTENETKIDALPIYTLIDIVKFLPMVQWPSLERVERRFQSAVHEAWRSLKEVRLADDLKIGLVMSKNVAEIKIQTLRLVLDKLLNRAPQISSLNFDYKWYTAIQIRSPESFRLLSQFQNLQCVHLTARSGALANFLETSASRHQLKELKLFVQGEEQGEPVDDDIFRAALGNENPNLAPLRLEKFSFQPVGFFHRNTVGFFQTFDVSRLTSLNVINTKINTGDLISIVERATTLESLEFNLITSCQNGEDGVHLAQNIQLLKTISTSGNLRSFKIDQHYQLYDGACKDGGCFDIEQHLVEMIREFGRRRRLEEFSLFDSWFVTDDVVAAIADNMQFLKKLELCPNDGCTIETLVNLVTKLKLLVKLSFVNTNPNFEGEAKILVPVLLALAKNLTNLTHLHLGNVVNDKETFKEFGRLVNLKDLYVMVIGDLEPDVMQAWGETFGPKLESLALISCGGEPTVGDSGLIPLIKKSPRLRTLSLMGSEITDESLHAMVERCPNLCYLGVTNCANITERGVQAIVDGCPNLEQLIIYDGRYSIFKKLKFAKYTKLQLICDHK